MSEEDKRLELDRTANQIVLQGLVGHMTPEQRQKVGVLADQIRNLVLANGEEGFAALGLVAADVTGKL